MSGTAINYVRGEALFVLRVSLNQGPLLFRLSSLGAIFFFRHRSARSLAKKEDKNASFCKNADRDITERHSENY